MNTVVLTSLLLGLLGQVMPPMLPNEPSQGGQEQKPPELTVHMVAFTAWDTGLDEPVIDEKLNLDEEVLAKLPFDHFEWVNEDEGAIELGPESKPVLLQVNDYYRVLVALAGQPGQDGNIPLHVEVLMRQTGGREEQALYGDALVSPNKWLIFRGLPMLDKELVILVQLKQGDGEGGEGQSQQEQEQKEEQEGEEEQEPQPGESQQDQQSSAAKEEQEPPQDLQNIEALLESLEEQDKREQPEARYNRENIRINKDWW